MTTTPVAPNRYPMNPLYGAPPPMAPMPPMVPMPSMPLMPPMPPGPWQWTGVPQAAPRAMPPQVSLVVPAGLRGRHRRRTLEHRDVTGGALRAAVFGAMDGLVTNASLIAGASGAQASNHTIVLTGFAGLVAGAFSMATGEYISVTSQNELTIAEVDTERIELAHNPARELAELTEVYIARGVQPHLAAEVARQLSRDPEQALAIHAREELGVDPDDLPSPWSAAGASFACFTGGALTPLLPYLIGLPSFALALVLAGIAALVGGAVVAKAANRSQLRGALRQFALGALATGMTFLVGQLIGAQAGG